ncbi:MAG: glycosyltransferase family 9 protein [Deltaproteobacteria bacterium]
MRILLFRLGALGDLLMTTPFVRQLRRRFPEARIEYWTGRSFSRILEGNPHLDEVIGFPEEIYFHRSVPGILRLVRSVRRRRYDMAFVLDRHWVFPLSAFLFGIRRRIGFDRLGREGILLTDRIRYSDVRHEILYYLDLLRPFGGADERDLGMEFFPAPREVASAERFWEDRGLGGDRVVCLAVGGGENPGQSMPWKRWPAEAYEELGRRLSADGFRVLLVGGPSDAAVAERIGGGNRFLSAVGASLGESAVLLSKACAVVCSDGGTMHLASAVTDRLISLFGPTDPGRLAPWNGYRLLRGAPPCAPCYDLHGRFPECPHGHACMREVDVTSVHAAVLDLAGRSSAGNEAGGREDR